MQSAMTRGLGQQRLLLVSIGHQGHSSHCCSSMYLMKVVDTSFSYPHHRHRLTYILKNEVGVLFFVLNEGEEELSRRVDGRNNFEDGVEP